MNTFQKLLNGLSKATWLWQNQWQDSIQTSNEPDLILVGIKFLEEQDHKYVSHCRDAQISRDDMHMFHCEEKFNFGHEYLSGHA